MPFNKTEDLLPFVQKPSRYLGTEVNRVDKDLLGVKMKILLAFPDLYDIGTSHFGIQILYNILNQQQEVLAERVFAPAKDMEKLLRENNLPLFSLESKSALATFDIIGFSLLYELNYTNVLNMLDLGGIPLRWKTRDENHPIILAGGPAVCNPEPMAEFFDAMVFGDGEDIIVQMVQAWLQWKETEGKSKEQLLEQWAQIGGIYVPRFFEDRYDDMGAQRLKHTGKGKTSITRTIVTSLDKASFPDSPIIPFGKPIHDRLRLEISRGCSRGCRFCQAGMIYRPVRERSMETIMHLVETALSKTGYEDLSLLSLSTGDYSCLVPLMERLMQGCGHDPVAVSLPSVRADSLSPTLMDLIRSVRKTGFTIAPEAGSQRLRDVINKNITEDDVANTVKSAFELGWNVIKLYFMIGLPTETDDDLDAIVQMVRRLQQIKGPSRRRKQINVSITTFVPKPHTPFQWAPQISLEESKRKISYLKDKLKITGVHVKWQKPEMSLLEGVLARGDRRVGNVIYNAWRNGSTFDGWNDQFNIELWEKALKTLNMDPDEINARERHVDDPLPWQHMDSGVDINFLKDQWQNARRRDMIEDCRYGKCHDCGVCDFIEIKPIVYNLKTPLDDKGSYKKESFGGDENQAYVWYSLKYAKMGNARLFGHLELANIFSRTVRRAGIKVQYSKGFHPMPKISFDDPLPLGIESEAEYLRIRVFHQHHCRDVVKCLNEHLPAGLEIKACELRSEAKKKRHQMVQRFSVQLADHEFCSETVGEFKKSSTWPYVRTNHKGRTHNIDLIKEVQNILQKDASTIVYEIAPQSQFTIRPADVLKGVFKMPADLLQGARIVKHDTLTP